MESATRKQLAEIAREKAQIPFHGYVNGQESNIDPLIQFFPKWNLKERMDCGARRLFIIAV